MEGAHENDNFESLLEGIFELSGEPAVVINGVPAIPVDDGNIVPSISPPDGTKRSEHLYNNALDAEKSRNIGFGVWLEGREVRKLFGQRYYFGTVTEFDKETGWYRVVYEDGDFEDLEWHELQDVLEPLDITLPLKSLALKVIRKSQKSELGSGRKVVGEREHVPKTRARRGRPRGTSSNNLLNIY